jgi:hypothetical protein
MQLLCKYAQLHNFFCDDNLWHIPIQITNPNDFNNGNINFRTHSIWRRKLIPGNCLPVSHHCHFVSFSCQFHFRQEMLFLEAQPHNTYSTRYHTIMQPSQAGSTFQVALTTSIKCVFILSEYLVLQNCSETAFARRLRSLCAIVRIVKVLELPHQYLYSHHRCVLPQIFHLTRIMI